MSLIGVNLGFVFVTKIPKPQNLLSAAAQQLQGIRVFIPIIANLFNHCFGSQVKEMRHVADHGRQGVQVGVSGPPCRVLVVVLTHVLDRDG